jgi:ribokinase
MIGSNGRGNVNDPLVGVVGSLMMDMVSRVPRWPRPGESLIATSFGLHLGGKGCNQAIAAARSGATSALIGRVGDDAFGSELIAALVRDGVMTAGVTRDQVEGTGVALPILNPAGENMIIVAPRANMTLTPTHVEAVAGLIRGVRVLLMQLEVPLDAVRAAARIGRAAGRTIVLNVAPAVPFDTALLRLCDILVANEVEIAALSAKALDTVDDISFAAASLSQGLGKIVVVTLGANGVLLADDRGVAHLPGHRVSVIDSTGAGDAFCGVMSAALANGEGILAAVEAGNAAGALAVQSLGAVSSLPERAAIQDLQNSSSTAWRPIRIHN